MNFYPALGQIIPKKAKKYILNTHNLFLNPIKKIKQKTPTNQLGFFVIQQIPINFISYLARTLRR